MCTSWKPLPSHFMGQIAVSYLSFLPAPRSVTINYVHVIISGKTSNPFIYTCLPCWKCCLIKGSKLLILEGVETAYRCCVCVRMWWCLYAVCVCMFLCVCVCMCVCVWSSLVSPYQGSFVWNAMTVTACMCSRTLLTYLPIFLCGCPGIGHNTIVS